jgi:hypothetical protein
VAAESMVYWPGGHRPSATALAWNRGVFYALDAESGEVLWEREPEGRGTGRVVGARDLWYGAGDDGLVALADEEGNVVGISLERGRVLWQTAYPVPPTTQEGGGAVLGVRGDASSWPDIEVLDGGAVAVTDLGLNEDGDAAPVTHVFDRLTGALTYTSTAGVIVADPFGEKAARRVSAGGATWLDPEDVPQVGRASAAKGACKGSSSPVLAVASGSRRIQICLTAVGNGSPYLEAAATDLEGTDERQKVMGLSAADGGIRLTMTDGDVWDVAKGCEVLRVFEGGAKAREDADLARAAAAGLSVRDELAAAPPGQAERIVRRYCQGVTPYRWQAPTPVTGDVAEAPADPGMAPPYRLALEPVYAGDQR